jgi:hypothetical protein
MKGPECEYDQRIICDTYVYFITANHVMVATAEIFDVMTSTLPLGTIGSVASLLAASRL